MKKGRAEQYRGRLTPAEIAYGMSAAARNARRLVADANLLLGNERYPSALSLAVLAIEEAGKMSILRGLSIVPDDKTLNTAWKNYRTHTAKNAAWIVIDLFMQGARSLDELRPMFDPSSDHRNVLDTLKQLGFYTDCFGDRHWSEPHEVIDGNLAKMIVTSAQILCPKREASTREIELWSHHLAPHWGTQEMAHAAVRYHEAMRAEGLEDRDPEEVRKFYGTEPTESEMG